MSHNRIDYPESSGRTDAATGLRVIDAGCTTIASITRSPVAASVRPGTRRPRADQLMRVAKRVLAWERAPAGSHVDITLLSAAAMRRVNPRATGRRGLTDVIPYVLPQPDRRFVGRVDISPA